MTSFCLAREWANCPYKLCIYADRGNNFVEVMAAAVACAVLAIPCVEAGDIKESLLLPVW